MYYAEHVSIDRDDILPEIMERHKKVIWAIDIMFINRIPFVMTKSCNIHLGTAELVKHMKNKTIMTSIEQVIRAYPGRGFKITTRIVNRHFKHIQKPIKDKGVNMNICAADAHSPKIVRYLRSVKEGLRSIATGIAFKRYKMV